MRQLPEGWAATTMADCAAFNPRHPDDIARDTMVSFVPMPAVDEQTGEIERPSVRPLAEVWKGYTHFREGDVIVAKITPCMENGKAAVARKLEGGLACGSTEFHVLRPHDGVSSDFLWRFVRQKSFREEAEQCMTGAVGQRRVPIDFLKTAELALPPAEEQRRIVAKVDSLSAKSMRARHGLDHVPRLVEQYRQAILSAACDGSLTQDWRVNHATPEPMPQRLLALVSTPVRNGLSIRGSDSPPGVRSLRLSALRSHTVNMDDVRFLPIDANRARPFLLEQGDVLVSRGNGTKRFVGIASLVQSADGPIIFPDTAFRIRLNQAVALPDWFTMVWNAPQTRGQIEQVAKTTAGIWKVSQGDLARIELLVPSIEEQRQILTQASSALKWIDRLGAEATSARKLIDHLDQAVLAKAFRGELVPQDPADEPASLLLERIRSVRIGTGGAVKRRSRPSTPAAI